MATWRGKVEVAAGHSDWVYTVAFSPDGKRFASGSADGTVRLWNTRPMKLVATLLQLTPRTAKWVIVTSQGYVATSSPKELTWKMKDKSPAPDALAEKLLNAESVRKVLAGEAVPAPALK